MLLENNLDNTIRELLKVLDRQVYNNTYFGIRTLKFPFDFWVYQEMIYELRPDVIVELGTYRGGSALALSHILEKIGKGRIITLDINHNEVPMIVRNDPRITLIQGDAVQSFPDVQKLIADGEKVLVIEDSSHTYENTLAVLRTYNSLIRIGSYFIVEDAICHHGIEDGPNPGPYEAIDTFLSENKNFVADRTKERMVLSWNLHGFLKRVS